MRSPNKSGAVLKRERNAGVQSALALCAQRGAQMTDVRRMVLETLWCADQPLGAYDLMSVLEARSQRKFSPPTIYRTLDFLLDLGLIARIESRNAYVPCADPDRRNAAMYFVCDQCSTSVEIENPDLEALVTKDAQSLGFEVGRRIVELQGTCASCRAAPASTGRSKA